MIISKIKRYLLRTRNPVDVTGLLNVKPISSVFGYDRGTPIDRFYIEHFLSQNKDAVHGRILEIAESTYSKKYATGKNNKYLILTYDESANKRKVIIGDLTKKDSLPLSNVDCFICTQTLNFIYDVKAAVEGMYKLLDRGGVALCTVSGLSQISRYDMERWGDYWRFTDLSIRKMFNEVFGENNVSTKIYGNAMSSIAFLQGLAVEDLPNKSLLLDADEDYQITIGIKAVKK